MRLIGGPQAVDGQGKRRRTLEGVLQIFHNGQWGTVCNDKWTFYNAEVACRQLGFSGADVAIANDPRYIGDAWSRHEPIWMDNVKCSGSEARLADCPFRGWGEENCNHFEDVAIKCKGSELETTVTIATTFFCVATALSIAALSTVLAVLVVVRRLMRHGGLPTRLATAAGSHEHGVTMPPPSESAWYVSNRC